MSAPFHKFQNFVTKMAAGDFKNALNASTDTIKLYLSDMAPDPTMVLKADLPEIPNVFGYAPVDTQNAASLVGGVIAVVGTSFILTAVGGVVGPFRYAVLYDDTLAGKPLIGWWDYGSSITMQDLETFSVNFGAAMFTVQ